MAIMILNYGMFTHGDSTAKKLAEINVALKTQLENMKESLKKGERV